MVGLRVIGRAVLWTTVLGVSLFVWACPRTEPVPEQELRETDRELREIVSFYHDSNVTIHIDKAPDDKDEVCDRKVWVIPREVDVCHPGGDWGCPTEVQWTVSPLRHWKDGDAIVITRKKNQQACFPEPPIYITQAPFSDTSGEALSLCETTWPAGWPWAYTVELRNTGCQDKGIKCSSEVSTDPDDFGHVVDCRDPVVIIKPGN